MWMVVDLIAILNKDDHYEWSALPSRIVQAYTIGFNGQNMDAGQSEIQLWSV
jgi:hypothetical protein